MSVTLYELFYDNPLLAEHRLFKFPAGEAHIEFKKHTHVQVAFVQSPTADDLFSIAVWNNACKAYGCETILLMPYLPGARADRGIPLGAKVYAEFINSLAISTVVCVDPHSDVSPAHFERLITVHLEELPHWRSFGHYAGIIAPDIGARKRADAVAAQLKLPVYQAMKHRDFETGKLSGFTCEPLKPSLPYLVVDDICDGGGTFLGLADALPDVRLSLWATHGVFSKNALKLLSPLYRKIYTTDSFYQNNSVVTFPLFDTMLKAALS